MFKTNSIKTFLAQKIVGGAARQDPAVTTALCFSANRARAFIVTTALTHVRTRTLERRFHSTRPVTTRGYSEAASPQNLLCSERFVLNI